jgi:hypothetical protein
MVQRSPWRHRAVFDAFIGVASTTRKKFIPFLNDVQTDRHFWEKVHYTVCTVSDAPKLENYSVNATRDDGGFLPTRRS